MTQCRSHQNPANRAVYLKVPSEWLKTFGGSPSPAGQCTHSWPWHPRHSLIWLLPTSSWLSLLAPWTPELPGASSRRHAASRVCTAPYTGLLISFLPDALLQHSRTSNRCFAMSVAQHLPRYYHAEWDHFLLIVKICVCISVSLCRLYNRRFIRTMITYLCLYPHQVAESFEHCRT